MLLTDCVKRETRLICNIQVVYQDLLPLAIRGNKIPGTTLDAFAAILQDRSENSDWCVFTSRLGPLVLGIIKESPESIHMPRL